MNRYRDNEGNWRDVAKALLLVVAFLLWAHTGVLAAASRPAQQSLPDDLALALASEHHADALAHYSAGLSAEVDGNYDEALAQYRAVVALEPDAIAAHNQILDLLLNQKRDVTAAIAHMEAAVKLAPKQFDLWFRLGDVYQTAKQTDKAIASYQQAIKIDPLGLIAYWRLTGIYASQNKYKEAVATLDQAARQKSDQAGYWSRLGDYYTTLWQQNPSAAEEQKIAAKMVSAYEKANALAPNDSLTMLRLAKSYALDKNFPKAIEFYNAILKNDPNEFDIRAELALVYIEAKEEQKAIAEWDKLIQSLPDTNPGKWECYYRKAELLEDLKQYDAAADSYLKALTLNPDSDAYLKLAGIFPNVSQKEKIYADTDQLIQAHSHWQWCRLKAELLEADKQYDAVVAAYRKGLEIDPTALDLYLDLSMAQVRQKKMDDARATLTEAQQKFPNSHLVPYFFGLLYSETKEYDKALLGFELAERLAQQNKVDLDGRFYFFYGAANERTGNIDKAADLFRKSLDLDPQSPDTLNYLGYMWADKGIHLDEASDLIKQALVLDPDNGAYLDSMGWVYFKQGKYNDALTMLRKAVDKLPEPDPDVYGHLADILYKLGKKDEAISYWKKATVLDPKNEELSRKLNNALGISGQAVPVPAPAPIH